LLQAFEGFKGSFVDLDRRTRTTAEEWKTAKAELRRELLLHGLEPGDIVVLALPNGALFAAAWAAIIEAGASPFLAHFESPFVELQALSRRAGARFIVTEHGDGAALTLAVGNLDRIALHESQVQEKHLNQLRPHSVPLHPTSGTTGESRIAIRPGPCAVAEALHYIETLGIERSDNILCVSPMSHAYAYGMCLMVPLLTSASVLAMRRFNPRLASRAILEGTVTTFPAVPAILDIFPYPAATTAGAGEKVRIVLSAGAPLGRKTAAKYREHHRITIRSLLGSTETGGISIAPTTEQVDESVGPPMNGVEVSIDTTEYGQVEEGLGMLQVRSSSLMSGYLAADQIDREPIVGGWFNTGDIARLERGHIVLRGRVSEVINVFGMKVIPSEVEAVISAIPEVEAVKVYPGKHRSGSDIVRAALICRQPVDEHWIREHCRQNLVAYKCPTSITFFEDFPRTTAGKIDVKKLPV
jgi:acyl-CoA synthetase (AMP-forming)/AMP-acid ligase II